MTENTFLSTVKESNFSSAYSSSESKGLAGESPASHQEAATYREALSFATLSSLKSAHRVLEEMDHPDSSFMLIDEHEAQASAKESIDPKTGRHCQDIAYKDGTTEHEEFDAATGKLLSDDSTDASGRKVHQDFDPTTGNMTLQTETTKNWSSTTHYDPITGNRTSRDEWDAGLSSTHTEYDFAGKPISSDSQYSDGDVEHTQFDPDTGNRQFSDYRYRDGATMHTEYGPDGNEKSVDSTNPDGTSKHEVVEPNGTIDTTYPNQTPWWELNPVGLVDRWISDF